MPPVLKPETKKALRKSIVELEGRIAETKRITEERRKERDNAQARLDAAQNALDAVKAEKQALVDDLGEPV